MLQTENLQILYHVSTFLSEAFRVNFTYVKPSRFRMPEFIRDGTLFPNRDLEILPTAFGYHIFLESVFHF